MDPPRHFITKILSVLVIAWTAAGCQHDYAEDQEHYRRILGTQEENDTVIHDSDPLTLTSAVRLTNHNNERLGLAGEDYVQAIIQRQRAVAEFLPTLDLAPSYTRRSGDLAGGGRDELNVGVELGYNVF
ncbi:MAG: hypothetical protein HC898_01375 [Phycisphaerales bacterium]|nr:hypothetical protein [Phycisphaerales bacterium]